MIDFIQRHIKNKQKSYAELRNDLCRFAQLLDDECAIEHLSFLNPKWVEFTTDENQSKHYSSAVNSLSAIDHNISKYKETEKRHQKGPSLADFFSGCGGLSEGFTQAGFNVVFANELEENFAESFYLNHNTPASNFHVGDIAQLHQQYRPIIEKLKNIDVVCGGPPCQGFSTANRQRLIDDPRNHLYRDYLTVLSIIRPKFFVIENVVGMAKRIDDIKADIKNYLGSDYKFEYTFLDASDFGIPQKRRRFILIANRVGIDPSEIFARLKKIKLKYKLKDALAGLPQLGVKASKNAANLENDTIGFKIRMNEDIKNTDYIRYINGSLETRFVYNHKNRYNNERDVEIFKRLPQGANSLHPSIADIMPYSSRNHMFKDKYFKLDENEVSKTITSHMKFDCNMYIHPTQARGLSPREAARVQSFPDNYFIRGSQNSWYQQIGNAVPVKMASAIAQAIKHYL